MRRFNDLAAIRMDSACLFRNDQEISDARLFKRTSDFAIFLGSFRFLFSRLVPFSSSSSLSISSFDMSWIPTFGGKELPALDVFSMLERLGVKPSQASDPEWFAALSDPIFAGASNGPDLHDSFLFLWRLKSMEAESSEKTLWRKYAAAGIVRILNFSFPFAFSQFRSFSNVT
jgi:hypothetical protein